MNVLKEVSATRAVIVNEKITNGEVNPLVSATLSKMR